MANIGYARVDPAFEDPQEQLDALRGAGCERVFDDRATGDGHDRPQLASALRSLLPEDTFIVWRLDRLDGGLGQRGPSALRRALRSAARRSTAR